MCTFVKMRRETATVVTERQYSRREQDLVHVRWNHDHGSSAVYRPDTEAQQIMQIARLIKTDKQ